MTTMPHGEAAPDSTASQTKFERFERIRRACRKRDLDLLRELATSEGGLYDDELRREAWPILLGVDNERGSATPNSKETSRHRDEDQVQLDVNRSFVYYPEGESEGKREARKAELSHIIVTVLRQHPVLHYFQGYHDIVQVLLLVLGVDKAIPAVSRLSLLRIRDFMLPSMTGTEPHLHLLPAVLYASDSTLANHLSQTQPFFALPATLTLYAHEIEEYGSIARLFDFLLASEAVIPVYLFAAVVISRKDKLLEIESDEPEMLHSILSKLPRPLDLEALIRQTVHLFEQYPPERLPGRIWSRISPSSVLKTTHNFGKLSKQTLEDGERFFELEAAEIRRYEARQLRLRQMRTLARRYQRPAAFTGMAVFIAVIAMLARGQGATVPSQGWHFAFFGLQQKAVELWRLLGV